MPSQKAFLLARFLPTLVLGFACLMSGVNGLADETARVILNETGTQGGLIVHLGCGDGKLTASLYANERFLVHGLDADAANVEKARNTLLAKGLYGKVSVQQHAGGRLPYADDMVNLLVAEDLGEIPMSEVLRVLTPNGKAYVKQDGKWETTTKPVPEEIDEWTHHLHGPDNNPVANDTKVGSPRRLKWVCKPLWSRSHEFLSSLSAMVSADGRLFYVFDEGLTGVTDPPIPERWNLVARDAFNGVLLWKRPLPDWGSRFWKRSALRSTPRSIPYRLVAGDDRLFATLGEASPVVALDAATGKIVATYDATVGAQEIRSLDGILLVTTSGGKLVVVDTATGKTPWSIDAKFRPGLLAASKDRVFYASNGKLHCVGLHDGKTQWQTDHGPNPSLMTVCDKLLLEMGRGQITARKVESGEQLWEAKGSVSRSLPFVANNRLYQPAGARLIVRDLSTGREIKTIDPDKVMTPGHHARCYPGKATESFFVSANRGIEFVDLNGANHSQNDWTRGPCTFGVLPCNGLLYVPPNPCFCYPGAKVTGFNAFAPSSKTPDVPARNAKRLERGPAFGKPGDVVRNSLSDDWPTYRHDARRTGASVTSLPANLQPSWQVELGGRLTQPVVAGGNVYVVSKDTHTLHVLDETSGEKRWCYTADARIDSPPTIDAGRVLFGCTDGKVYCLRESDGMLFWRFQAAPNDRRIVAFGQLESPWRVHGSVLIEEGIAYFTAGRSTFLDGGIRLFGLDPATGKVLYETCLDTWSPTREDAKNKPFIPGYHMEGALSDILVAEGGSIYLGQYKFDRALVQQDVPYDLPDPNKKSPAMGLEELTGKPYVQNIQTQIKDEPIQRNWQLRQWPEMARMHKEKYGASNVGERTMGRHVFSTSGFLDDAWYNRTFWMYSETWPGFHIANRGAKTGQILSVDAKTTYAVQAYPRRNLQSPLFTPGDEGYLLFADDNENEPILPDYTRGVPKGIGFTRKDPPLWHRWIPLRVRAMVATEGTLFVAGTPDVLKEKDPMAAVEGRLGARLWAVSPKDGTKQTEYKLDAPPVFDGMTAAGGKLYVSLENGKIVCWGQHR